MRWPAVRPQFSSRGAQVLDRQAELTRNPRESCLTPWWGKVHGGPLTAEKSPAAHRMGCFEGRFIALSRLEPECPALPSTRGTRTYRSHIFAIMLISILSW